MKAPVTINPKPTLNVDSLSIGSQIDFLFLEGQTGISRHDDFYFLDKNQGWIINADGMLHQTKDGGNTWNLIYQKPQTYFRCMGFQDEKRGWIGTLGLDDPYLFSNEPHPLWYTKDSGFSWQAITQFEGPKPKGLCAFQILDNETMFAAGRVRGPSYFIKTKDGGNTWTSIDLTPQIGGIMDVYFFDEQHGLLVGGTASNAIEDSKSQILATQDGGNTWKTIFTGSQIGEWCWKISFPSSQVGYISIQRKGYGNYYFLKSEDGGNTWEERIFSKTPYFAQGIGFINEQIGWIGGSRHFTYQTEDGGVSWEKIDAGRKLNKFRFINDSLGFTSGLTKHKIQLLKK